MNRAEVIARMAAGEDPRDLSIEKWEQIKAGTGEREGSDNCALCAAYEPDCQGCPVSQNPGHGCDIRPFKPWRRHSDNNHGQSIRVTPGCEECQRLLDEGIALFKKTLGK